MQVLVIRLQPNSQAKSISLKKPYSGPLYTPLCNQRLGSLDYSSYGYIVDNRDS